jgi:hypothetical protein
MSLPGNEATLRAAVESEKARSGAFHGNVAIRLTELAQFLVQSHRLTDAEPILAKANYIFSFDMFSKGQEAPSQYFQTALEGWERVMGSIGLDRDTRMERLRRLMDDASFHARTGFMRRNY